MILDETNYLAHHGVKGMKWGVRRNRKKTTGVRSFNQKKTTTTEEISKMDDKELQKKINRLNMEKRYSDLTKKQKSIGKKLVDDIVVQSGKEVAKKYVTKAMVYGVEIALANTILRK